MHAEIPLQHDMFTDELVDNRTRTQKRKATQQARPQQMELFPTRTVAQFGVSANPKLPISPKTRLELAMIDLRTEEEREQDLQREIAAKTGALFDKTPGENGNASEAAPRVFKGHADRRVTVNDDPLPITETANRHSPDGYNWGYGGSGPAALAHAMLACVAGEAVADVRYEAFKHDVVAAWETGQPWEITELEVLAWLGMD